MNTHSNFGSKISCLDAASPDGIHSDVLCVTRRHSWMKTDQHAKVQLELEYIYIYSFFCFFYIDFVFLVALKSPISSTSHGGTKGIHSSLTSSARRLLREMLLHNKMKEKEKKKKRGRSEHNNNNSIWPKERPGF